MAKISVPVISILLIACFCLQNSDASLCKPNSEFKLDCNTCKCSSSGTKFSCTSTICDPLIYKDKFLIEQNEKGYSILKPKSTNNLEDNKKLDNNGNSLFVNENQNNGKLRRTLRFILNPYRRYPFINNNKIIQDPFDNSEDVDSIPRYSRAQYKNHADDDGYADNNNDNYDDYDYDASLPNSNIKSQPEYINIDKDDDLNTWGRISES